MENETQRVQLFFAGLTHGDSANQSHVFGEEDWVRYRYDIHVFAAVLESLFLLCLLLLIRAEVLVALLLKQTLVKLAFFARHSMLLLCCWDDLLFSSNTVLGEEWHLRDCVLQLLSRLGSLERLLDFFSLLDDRALEFLVSFHRVMELFCLKDLLLVADYTVIAFRGHSRVSCSGMNGFYRLGLRCELFSVLS